MAVVAYLRVSTEKQFLENQRAEILRFADRNGLIIDKWSVEVGVVRIENCREYWIV